MSEELKPCPFCGGEKINVYPQTCRQSDPERDGDRAYPMAQCRTCFAEVAGENFPRLFGDTSSAIAAWNTRACLDMADPAELVAGAYEAAAMKFDGWDNVPVQMTYDESRDRIRSLTPADAQDALDAAIAKAVNEKLDEAVSKILAEAEAYRGMGFLASAQALNIIAGDVLAMKGEE